MQFFFAAQDEAHLLFAEICTSTPAFRSQSQGVVAHTGACVTAPLAQLGDGLTNKTSSLAILIAILETLAGLDTRAHV